MTRTKREGENEESMNIGKQTEKCSKIFGEIKDLFKIDHPMKHL